MGDIYFHLGIDHNRFEQIWVSVITITFVLWTIFINFILNNLKFNPRTSDNDLWLVAFRMWCSAKFV